MSNPRFPSLTLIVATTPSLGLGFRGTLPWPPLKADLAFFARVTKRGPPYNRSPPQTSNFQVDTFSGLQKNIQRRTMNAVIMGRKTWDSIPSKFRPLKGRINVVVSRLTRDAVNDSKEGIVIRVGSIEEGLERLQRGDWINEIGDQAQETQDNTISLGRIFVIGGAQIYDAALAMDCCERIIWTRIEQEWDCDVWFPKGVLGEKGKIGGWERRGKMELNAWCGEKNLGERKEEDGTDYVVEMWERSRTTAEMNPSEESSGAGQRQVHFQTPVASS